MGTPAWEKAAARFLSPWKRRRDVLGAFLTGSRVLGTAHPRSDVDLIILLADGARARPPLDRRVDGFAIECTPHTAGNLREIFKAERMRGIRSCTRQIAFGKVVHDRGGAAADLQRTAVAAVRQKIHRQPPLQVAEDARHLATALAKVGAARARGTPGFWLVYYTALPVVVYAYARRLRAEMAPPGKLWPFLTDRGFRERYRMPEFPDRVFAGRVVSALRARTRTAAWQALSRLAARAGCRLS